MSTASITNQLAYVLNALFWEVEDIEAYKEEHGVVSVKRDLRPGGDPTRPLPAILSHRTRAVYFQTAKTFFVRARDLTGKRRLVDLLDPEIVRRTLDTHYRDHQPSTLRTVLAAIGKVHQGCVQVGWTDAPSPITDDLRDDVKQYRDDGDVRQPRFGYLPEDAERILVYLKENGSKFALPAEIALRCGLRLSEIAGLQGKHVDLENMQLHVVGKGGRNGTWTCQPAWQSKSILPSNIFSIPVGLGSSHSTKPCGMLPGTGDPGKRGTPFAGELCTELV